MAFAKAITQNTTFESFTIDACSTQMGGGDAVLAIAETSRKTPLKDLATEDPVATPAELVYFLILGRTSGV